MPLCNYIVYVILKICYYSFPILMVEQPQRGVHKHHPMFVRSLDALIIHDTSTRRRQISDSTFPRPMHIIREREESIARTAHTIQLTRPLRSLLCSQWFGNGIELAFPLCLLTTIERLTTHE